jgi:acyl-CoA hydrolase
VSEASQEQAKPGKPVRDSMSEYTELIQPNDANPRGTLFGGKLMQLVDMAGALAAVRHSRCAVVTASVDQLTFLRPVRIGQLVVLKSAVNRVFHSSMEVGVKVFVEDLRSGDVRHVSSAYLTFVALDQAGKKVSVAQVIAETPEEERRYEEAGRRREYRLQEKARALARE